MQVKAQILMDKKQSQIQLKQEVIKLWMKGVLIIKILQVVLFQLRVLVHAVWLVATSVKQEKF